MNSEPEYREQAGWAYGLGQAIGEILRAETTGSVCEGRKLRHESSRGFPRMEHRQE